MRTTNFFLSQSQSHSSPLLHIPFCFCLTGDPVVPNSATGRALYSTLVRFRQLGNPLPASFTTFFSFSITNLNPFSFSGGLAFLISPNAIATGDPGGSLGLGGPSFLPVEFDTLMDVEFHDINRNHVGLDLNGVVSTQASDLGSLGIDLKSGDTMNAWIDYDGRSKWFRVWVSYSNVRPKDPILKLDLDVGQYVNKFRYMGFSGSTQGSMEVHSVEWWSFSSTFDATTAAPPPPTAPSSQQKETTKSSCHSGLCKQGMGAVAGVVTAGAFALFAVALIWLLETGDIWGGGWGKISNWRREDLV